MAVPTNPLFFFFCMYFKYYYRWMVSQVSDPFSFLNSHSTFFQDSWISIFKSQNTFMATFFYISLAISSQSIQPYSLFQLPIFSILSQFHSTSIHCSFLSVHPVCPSCLPVLLLEFFTLAVMPLSASGQLHQNSPKPHLNNL